MLKQRSSVKSSRGWPPKTRAGVAIGRPSTRSHSHKATETAVDDTVTPGTRPLTVGDIPAIVQQVTAAFSNQTENGSPPAPSQTRLRNASHSHSAREEEGRQPPIATTTRQGLRQGEETTTQQPLTLGDMPSLVDAVVNRLAGNRASSSSDPPGSFLLL